MKKLMILPLLAFSFFACQKEKPSLVDLKTEPNYTIYSNTQSSGMDSLYKNIPDSELVDFSEKIMAKNWTMDVSFNRAMFLSEVYSNLVISIIDVYDKVAEVKTEVFTIEVGVTEVFGERFVDGDDLQAMVDEIYLECETRLDDVNFASSGDGNYKFIKVVDLDWEEDNNGDATQYVTVRVVLAKQSLSVGCGVTDHWYGWDYINGGCNGNSSTIGSTDIMDIRLNSSYCNSSLGCKTVTGSGDYYTYYNVSNKIDLNFVIHGANKIWRGTRWECLSPTDLDGYIDEAENVSLIEQPYVTGSSGPKKAIISYDLESDLISGGCSDCYIHQLDLEFAQCKKLHLECSIYNALKVIDD